MAQRHSASQDRGMVRTDSCAHHTEAGLPCQPLACRKQRRALVTMFREGSAGKGSGARAAVSDWLLGCGHKAQAARHAEKEGPGACRPLQWEELDVCMRGAGDALGAKAVHSSPTPHSSCTQPTCPPASSSETKTNVPPVPCPGTLWEKDGLGLPPPSAQLGPSSSVCTGREVSEPIMCGQSQTGDLCVPEAPHPAEICPSPVPSPGSP